MTPQRLLSDGHPLTASQILAFNNSLGIRHRKKLRCLIYDADGHVLSDFTSDVQAVLGGQVNIDANSESLRTLELVLSDPRRRIHVDPNSASPLSIYPNRFVYVEQFDWVSALDDYVVTPLFYGPPTTVERDSDTLTINARSPEYLLRDPHHVWETVPLPRGMNIIAACEKVLRSYGEVRLRLTTTSHRLGSTTALTHSTDGWGLLRRFVRALPARQLMYGADGFATIRGIPRGVSFAFRQGDLPGEPPPTVTEVAKATYDFTSFVNVVNGYGPQPEKGKKQLHHVESLPRTHPLSPQNLGRHGVPRYLIERLDVEHVSTEEQLAAVVHKHLQLRAEMAQVVEFSCLPVPHLDPMDMCALMNEDHSTTFRLATASIPLTGNGTMSVGYSKMIPIGRRVSPWR